MCIYQSLLPSWLAGHTEPPCRTGEVATSAEPVAAPSTMPRRCSATGGASTGAASSAVSILLQNLSCHSWGGHSSKGRVHRRCPWHWEWQWPEVTLSIMIPASPCASWAWQSWGESSPPREVLSCLRAEHIHLHSCQPFPQESKGSWGWKPGLSMAHAEEEGQWQSLVCTDLSSAGLLPVVLGLAEAEGTVIKLLPWSPVQTRTAVRTSTAELLML